MKTSISLPDDLAKAVREAEIPVSDVCAEALQQEVARLQTLDQLTDEMDTLTIELWGPDDSRYEAEFLGRWLVFPDADETRTSEPGYDAGAYYGVALTGKGQIAVYVAHCNEGWAPALNTHASIDDASGDYPQDILATAATELGESMRVRLHI